MSLFKKSAKVIRSWGNYPIVKSNSVLINKMTDIQKSILKDNIIPFGNGRSYGDSALSKNIILLKKYKSIISFDKKRGIIEAHSGALLSDIINLAVPKGWFPKTVPGTKLITIGGAIASDIHGKNHHSFGTFSESLISFNLLLPNGKIINCSKKINSDLYKATCGGMGLTGIILDAKFNLKKINSIYINQKTIISKNLKETFESFEKYSNYPYSVAWIDCLSGGKNLGRSLLMVGDFCNDGNLKMKNKPKINIPFYFPSFALNKLTVKIFNFLFFYKAFLGNKNKKVSLENFFFPLDSIRNWNRIYGKKGFTQYQFILPKSSSFEGLSEILKEITKSGKGSFLAVLKLYGSKNENYLSFPLEGYSLALDFKIEPGIFELLDKLDKIVVKHKGRIYLSKDVRVKKEVFEQGYPDLDKFREIRKNYSMDKKFKSLQSERLGL